MIHKTFKKFPMSNTERVTIIEEIESLFNKMSII